MKRKLFIVLLIIIVLISGITIAAVSCNQKEGPTEPEVLQYFHDNKNALARLKDQLKGQINVYIKSNQLTDDYLIYTDLETLNFDDYRSDDEKLIAASDANANDINAEISKSADVRTGCDIDGNFFMSLWILSLKDGVWYGIYFVEDDNIKPPISTDYQRKIEDNWYFFWVGLV